MPSRLPSRPPLPSLPCPPSLNAVPSHFRQILLAAVRKLSPYRGAQDLPQEDSRPEGVDLAAGSSTASATGGPGHDAQCNPVGLAPHALPHLLGLAPWLSGNTAAMLLAPLDDVAFQLASPVVHVVAMPSLFAVAPEALVGLGPEALLAGTFCPEPDTPSAASRHLAADVARLYARDVRPFFPAVAQATANYHRWLLQRVLGDCAYLPAFPTGGFLLFPCPGFGPPGTTAMPGHAAAHELSRRKSRGGGRRVEGRHTSRRSHPH